VTLVGKDLKPDSALSYFYPYFIVGYEMPMNIVHSEITVFHVFGV
jgi:hypothetical protein